MSKVAYVSKTVDHNLEAIAKIASACYYPFGNSSAGIYFFGRFVVTIDHNCPTQLMFPVYRGSEAAFVLDSSLHIDWQFTLADKDLGKANGMRELGGLRSRVAW